LKKQIFGKAVMNDDLILRERVLIVSRVKFSHLQEVQDTGVTVLCYQFCAKI
jgi:hypothetical protein